MPTMTKPVQRREDAIYAAQSTLERSAGRYVTVDRSLISALAYYAVDDDEESEEVETMRRELGLLADADRATRLRQAYKLTPVEARILVLIFDSPFAVCRKQWIYETIYGDREDTLPVPKIIDVYVSKIRAKLPKDSIKTVWCEGYALTKAGRAACEKPLTT